MKVVLVRCGRTQSTGSPRRTAASDQRPLSPEGRRAVREAAQGLASLLGSATAVASSPLIAAIETAAIFARSLGITATEIPQLDPASAPGDLKRWLGKRSKNQCLVLMGHEPALSKLACNLLAGGNRFFQLKHAGACLIDLQFEAKLPRAKLEWILTPKQLRRAGKRR